MDTDLAIVHALNGTAPTPTAASAHVERARLHGVSALLALALEERGVDLATAPELEEALAAHELYERLHLARLREVLDALDDAGIRHVLLKGTPVAHQYYPRPAARSRGDTDVLVEPAAFEQVAALFGRLGYERALDAGGRRRRTQASFEATDAVGCLHVFDVHAAISDRQVFARAFCWGELNANARSVPTIHHSARSLTPGYQLLHACLHRAAHMHAPYRVDHQEHHGDRLVWLYDVALIARTLEDDAWRALAELAREKALAEVLLAGLEAARKLFPFDIPAATTAALTAVRGEPSARLLRIAGTSALLEDVRAVEGWRPRLALVVEIAFPPAAYMQQRYGNRSDLLLPWLYLRRAVRGALKQFRS